MCSPDCSSILLSVNRSPSPKARPPGSLVNPHSHLARGGALHRTLPGPGVAAVVVMVVVRPGLGTNQCVLVLLQLFLLDPDTPKQGV